MEDLKKCVTLCVQGIEGSVAHHVLRPVLFQCTALDMPLLQNKSKKQEYSSVWHLEMQGYHHLYTVILMTVLDSWTSIIISKSVSSSFIIPMDGITYIIWGCWSRWQICEWQGSTHSISSGMPLVTVRLLFHTAFPVFRLRRRLLIAWQHVTVTAKGYFLFWICIHV
jgi:hypothetical protein